MKNAMNDVSLQVTSYFLNEVLVLLLRVFYLVFFAVTLILEGLTGAHCDSLQMPCIDVHKEIRIL